jgi:hypothetical protein
MPTPCFDTQGAHDLPGFQDEHLCQVGFRFQDMTTKETLLISCIRKETLRTGSAAEGKVSDRKQWYRESSGVRIRQ